MHQECFELLIRQIDPLLNEGGTLSITNLFNEFKSILKDNDYKLIESYSLARLKQRLVKIIAKKFFWRSTKKKHFNLTII